MSVAGTAATVSAADIPLTTEEKSLLARGFHITARGDSAERIFCRREVAVGSHIASDEVCGTVRQLKERTQQTQEDLRAGYASSSTPSAAARHVPRAQSGTDRELCSRGAPEAAIASCTRIIQDPRTREAERAIALRNRGWLLQAAGDLDRAIDDYSAALKLGGAPGVNARTYVNRGSAYASKGDEVRARADYDEAVTLDSTLSSAYLNRAALSAKGSQYDSALKDLDVAVRLSPKEATAYIERGIIYLRRAAWDRAIAEFSTAISVDPQSATAWRQRGVAYRLAGDAAKASADAEQAIRLDPQMAEAHQDLALVKQASARS